MQVQTNSTFYQSFGGINFINADIDRLKIPALITKHLGSRSILAKYSYADIFKSLCYTYSIGGDVLDDLNTLKKQLSDQPDLVTCSPDTVEYGFNELKQNNAVIIGESGATHQINKHDGFNTLLIDLCAQGGLLTTHTAYTIDYDGHIVENTKNDNAKNYKRTDSYYPVVASINKLPIYMENRNGNTPESYRQLAVIQEAFSLCRAKNIEIDKFRADACCYEKTTIEYLESIGVKYYIRAEMNAGLRIALQDEPEWEPVLLNNCKVEVCSIEEKLFNSDKYRRIVAYRKKVTGQLNIDDADGYRYHAIVTGDTQGSPLEVIEFYNQRGCQGEHHFKELDNDFGWGKLPFDTMAMNTIYMYSSIVAYIIINICKCMYAQKLSFITPQMRLKNFILHFVTLTARWIKTGRRYVLKIFTIKDYSPIYKI